MHFIFPSLPAFFIAIISASLIMLAAHYRNTYLKGIRYERLSANIKSGTSYVLAEPQDVLGNRSVDLYGNKTDSLEVLRKHWGIYYLTILKAVMFQDTLSTVFLVGTDAQKDSVALYLSDEDRPVSVSGGTRIIGDAMVPKSGIRQSYVDGKPYTGEKIVYGRTKDSERKLNPLDENFLKQIQAFLQSGLEDVPLLPKNAALHISFLDSTKIYTLKHDEALNTSISGNVILLSDTVVKISANAKLDNILLFAPAIEVEDGFSGNCQLFASDSITVGKHVVLRYPSVVGLVSKEDMVDQSKISIGEGSEINGIIFSYEKKRSALQTMISLGKNAVIKGEIYCTGMVKLEREIHLSGKVSCNRFVMKTPSTLYENFLIDVFLDRKSRSKYYLSSSIFKNNYSDNKILKWLK